MEPSALNERAVCILIEADEHLFVGDEDGAFDELSVGGERLERLFEIHIRQAIFEATCAIALPRDVEERSDIEPRALMEHAKRRHRGRRLDEVDRLEDDAERAEERRRLSAGGAFGILIERRVHPVTLRTNARPMKRTLSPSGKRFSTVPTTPFVKRVRFE